MIRSSKLSLKFCNANRRASIAIFLDEYVRVVEKFIDILWDMPKVSCLLDKEITKSVKTWLSARMIQCAGKQASGIVRGTRRKQEKRLWQIKKLLEEGKFKKARKLQKIYDEASVSKPELDELEAQLDKRFIKIEWNNITSFDGWIMVASIGNKMKILIPVKKTKHFNSLAIRGELKDGLRLSKENATFCFDIQEAEATGTEVLGVDIGMIDTLRCSDGQVIGKDKHGHSYQSICEKLARKRKGSKGFERAARHRTNFLHWSVNQLNLSNVSVLQREDIRDLRKFKRNKRSMQAWNYGELFKILDGAVSELGVQVRKRNPAYTSQRCSECGWTWRGNRKGKRFECVKCGHTQDADSNASRNLSFDLEEISVKELRRRRNRTGFYWAVKGQEPIVPAVQRAVS